VLLGPLAGEDRLRAVAAVERELRDLGLDPSAV
jgi:hypothetical protein